jgi:cytidylate kinase
MWTGAMYRAIALFDAKRYIAAEYFDKESLINSLPTIRIQFRYNPELALPKCI